jgi:hypothetical protein
MAGLLLPRLSRAQAVPVELTWDAPPECPSRAAVLGRVRELVGTAGEGAPPVRAEGEIKKVGGAFELRLLTEQEGQRGERRVRSASCEDLRGVTAVALTLLLTAGREPDTTTTSDATAPSSSAPSPEPTPPPTDLEPVPETEPEGPPSAASPRSVRFLLAAPQLALQIGPLPKPSPAWSAGFGVESGGWSARVLGQWGRAERIAAPIGSYGAEVQRAVLGLWLCSEHRVGAVSLAPCLQGSLARLRATGYGDFLIPTARVQLTWAVGAGVIGRAHLTSWLALMLTAGAQIELQRPELRLDGTVFDDTVGPIRRLASRSALLLVGPEWIF